MGLGAMMAGGNPDPKRMRQENDFYPSPPDVTLALMTVFKPWFDYAWEPCAGNGAMSDVIESVGRKVYSSDIVSRRADIVEQDFFKTSRMPPKTDCIITNPPFAPAEKFIRHAFENVGCQRMALLLKSTFFHAKGRTPLFNQYRPSTIMPLTWRPDFMQLGRPVMEVSWFVWNTPCANYTEYKLLNRPR